MKPDFFILVCFLYELTGLVPCPLPEVEPAKYIEFPKKKRRKKESNILFVADNFIPTLVYVCLW
jgi:hypothetical protein